MSNRYTVPGIPLSPEFPPGIPTRNSPPGIPPCPRNSGIPWSPEFPARNSPLSPEFPSRNSPEFPEFSTVPGILGIVVPGIVCRNCLSLEL